MSGSKTIYPNYFEVFKLLVYLIVYSNPENRRFSLGTFVFLFVTTLDHNDLVLNVTRMKGSKIDPK